jgi:hypothetical protein
MRTKKQTTTTKTRRIGRRSRNKHRALSKNTGTHKFQGITVKVKPLRKTKRQDEERKEETKQQQKEEKKEQQDTKKALEYMSKKFPLTRSRKRAIEHIYNTTIEMMEEQSEPKRRRTRTPSDDPRVGTDMILKRHNEIMIVAGDTVDGFTGQLQKFLNINAKTDKTKKTQEAVKQILTTNTPRQTVAKIDESVSTALMLELNLSQDEYTKLRKIMKQHYVELASYARVRQLIDEFAGDKKTIDKGEFGKIVMFDIVAMIAHDMQKTPELFSSRQEIAIKVVGDATSRTTKRRLEKDTKIVVIGFAYLTEETANSDRHTRIWCACNGEEKDALVDWMMIELDQELKKIKDVNLGGKTIKVKTTSK